MDGAGTHGAVRDRLNEFAGVRAETLAKIAPLSQAQLDFPPGSGRWSIGEIADHLRLSELLWRDEISALVELARAGKPAHIRHSFADINVSPVYIPDPIMSMFEVPLGLMSRFVPDAVLGMMLEFPILPMRNPDMATPRARRPAADLTADLEAALKETRRLIDLNVDLEFERMVTEHPLMGANNVPQVLTLLARHERRHQRQMDRVRSDSRFPRT